MDESFALPGNLSIILDCVVRYHLRLTVGECNQSGKLINKETNNLFLQASPVFLSCLPLTRSFIHLSTLVFT